MKRGETEFLSIISFDIDEDGQSDATLRSTRNHPFWTQEEGWVEASDLEEGNHLQTVEGKNPIITASHDQPWRGETWNLTIDARHAFFVVKNGIAILVHNTNPGPRTWIAYEFEADGNHIVEVRRKDRGFMSQNEKITKLEHLKGSMQSSYYSGHAGRSVVDPFDGWDVLKRRYSTGFDGLANLRWQNIPGTDFQGLFHVPLKNARVWAFPHEPGESRLGNKVCSSAKARALGAEHIINEGNKTRGKSMNVYTPLSERNAFWNYIETKTSSWKCD